MNLPALSIPGIIILSFLFFNSNFTGTVKSSTEKPDDLITCEMDIGEDVQLELGNSHQFNPQFSCPLTQIESFNWWPTNYLSCEDCLDPLVSPLESQCYMLTVHWDDGCITNDEICVLVRTCEPLYSENKINSISPQQISDQAEIELEIARTQFVHIEIVENDEVQFVIWEGFLKAGLRTVNLDFSAVSSGAHELRVRLYPEDQFIDILKM